MRDYLTQRHPNPLPNPFQIRHLELGIWAFGQKMNYGRHPLLWQFFMMVPKFGWSRHIVMIAPYFSTRIHQDLDRIFQKKVWNEFRQKKEYKHKQGHSKHFPINSKSNIWKWVCENLDMDIWTFEQKMNCRCPRLMYFLLSPHPPIASKVYYIIFIFSHLFFNEVSFCAMSMFCINQYLAIAHVWHCWTWHLTNWDPECSETSCFTWCQ
jgi:hypothetical protein